MPEYSQQEVLDAFNSMLRARDAVVKLLAMTEPADAGVPLGSAPQPPGASDAQIHELEMYFGKKFPPSFKHFLMVHNGSPWANLGSDIFSVEQMIAFDRGEKQNFFKRNLIRVKRDNADPLIVFAASNDRNNVIMFESDKPDEFGEWPTIYLSKRDKVLLSHADFVKFMEQATENLEHGLRLYRR
jgi:hypothetical protein